MKLIGNLKNKVDRANSKEEARSLIEQAGMKLTADELEIVTGGTGSPDGFVILDDRVTDGTDLNDGVHYFVPVDDGQNVFG